MNRRLTMAFASTGLALILLTGCVSSRKYKASQAELAKVRNDSAQLASQVTSLNGNVKDMQDKNASLQKSLDDASSRSATQQKSLDAYQSYFKEQQNTLSQVGDDVKGALTQAGVANADVQQYNNAIYVRMDEDELFKKNSMTITPAGKAALDNLANVIKNRSNVNVSVGAGDSAVGTMSAMDNSTSSDMAETPKPRHHRPHATASHPSGTAATTGTSATGAAAQNNTATAQSSATPPKHPKVHHRASSEGSMAIYNEPGHMHNRAWAIKQGRMVTVAHHFLKNGVPKVNVSLQNPSMNGSQDKTIKIIFVPKTEDFKAYSSAR